MAQLAPNPSVYVGNLDPLVTEQSLYDHFVRCGPVMSVRVCVDAASQKSLGYGYVNFQNPADAEKALDELNFSKLLSKHIRVAKIQRDPSQRRSGVNNIVVKRLPPNMDVPALKEIYSKYGRITSLKIAADEQGISRGYAYISYEKEDSAVEAVQETNNMEIDGKSIAVERYQPQFREEQQKQFTNLFVRNLDVNVTDDAFQAFFNQYGQITSYKIRRLDGVSAPSTYGYVAYATHEEAARAVEETDEKEASIAAANTKLAVGRFQPRSERKRIRERLRRERQLQYSKYPNLYVKNFDEDVTGDQLRDLFERVGPTISVRIMVDPNTKGSRCFGFVSMRDNASAQKAISELYGSTFLGPRPLFVTYAVKRDVRRQTLEEMQRKTTSRVRNFNGMGPGMGGMGGGMGFPPMMQNSMFSGGMSGPSQLPLMPPRNPMGGMMGGPMQMRQFPQVQQQNFLQQQQQQQQQQQYMQMRGPFPQAVRPPAAKPSIPMMQAPVQPMVPQQQSLSAILASMNPEQQKNVLGERLYNYILRKNPAEAAKVTGMLLEMDNSEILNLLDTNELLDAKINEALDVLHRHAAM